MKAKEYYAKYHDAKDTAAPGAIQTQMLYDFRQELDALQKQRKAKTFAAQNGITRELNDKWNAVVALFEAKDGKSPIQKDTFINWRTKGSTQVKKGCPTDRHPAAPQLFPARVCPSSGHHRPELSQRHGDHGCFGFYALRPKLSNKQGREPFGSLFLMQYFISS